MVVVFIVGIFLSLFLSALLFAKKQKTMADNILGMWMIVLAIQLTSYCLYYLGYWEVYPHLIGATTPFPLLIGPLLYLYVDFSLRKEQRFCRKDWLHFIPFVVTYLAMMPFLFGYSAEQKKVSDSLDFNSEFKPFFIIGFIVFIASAVIYPFLAYRKITHYQHYISDHFAYKESISLKWLKNIIRGAVLVFISFIIVVILQEGLSVNFGFRGELIPDTMIVILIGAIGFYGIRQHGIFSDIPAVESVSSDPPKEMGEYRKSGLKASDVEVLYRKLLSLMDQEKPYLEPKISLSQLAEKLEITPNNLSQVINQCDRNNFYDFVNRYRVREFISLATSPDNKHISLLGLAFDAGFNSKSSFNQVFKKTTGTTPREYLKQH